jgi:hypothetical protein
LNNLIPIGEFALTNEHLAEPLAGLAKALATIIGGDISEIDDY